MSSLSLEESICSGSISLLSKEGTSFSVDKKWACISKLVNTIVEKDPECTEIPLVEINTKILEYVVNFINEHKGEEPPIVERPLRSKLMKEVTNDWDANFIDQIGEQRSELYELISAANYLDIQSLLHLGCAKVAALIKGQPIDKIKDILLQK